MKKVLLVLLLLALFYGGYKKFYKPNKEKKENKQNTVVKADKSKYDLKDDYESLNGKKDKNGKEYRKVSIDKKNVFEKATVDDIVKKIENKETFYVYFGSKLCPWCRSVIEMADQVSRNKKISIIYYVDVWDDEGNELFRSKYEFEKGKIVKKQDGSVAYNKLLSYFSTLLSEYTLSDAEGNTMKVGEKRIYAPNFMYVENGELKRLTTGKSKNQTKADDALTETILENEKDEFNKFFK